MNSSRLSTVGLPILMLFIFIAISSLLRPVIWPDETRYLTVSWEMWVRHDFVVPTVNFSLYHQKPPLLFWVIDLLWGVFGVSRLAALGAIFAISSTVILLTRRFAEELFQGEADIVDLIAWALLGNVVFVIYSGLILFDLLLTSCVLGALIVLLVHARSSKKGSLLRIAVIGLSIGLGILAKGPVVLIFVLWPVATYPLWRSERHVVSAGGLWAATGMAVLFALVPVAAWIGPALIETGGEFGRALIWQQTAGRISGSLANSHHRSFWFYLPLLPIFAMPWIFSPYVWRAHRAGLSNARGSLRTCWRRDWALRFLTCWMVPVLVTFSLIGGKQPHYLVPILPGAAVLSAYVMRTIKPHLIRLGALIMLGLGIVAQIVAAFTVFHAYDLTPFVQRIEAHDGPVAFVGDYQGEFGFLGRLRQPLTVIAETSAPGWLTANPSGMLVDLDNSREAPVPGRIVYEVTSRVNRSMAISVGAAASEQ